MVVVAASSPLVAASATCRLVSGLPQPHGLVGARTFEAISEVRLGVDLGGQHHHLSPQVIKVL